MLLVAVFNASSINRPDVLSKTDKSTANNQSATKTIK